MSALYILDSLLKARHTGELPDTFFSGSVKSCDNNCDFHLSLSLNVQVGSC